MTSTGRFTLPSEENFAEKTKELAELWGADAIRNSDGTHLDEAVLALGKKIYSAYFPTRAHNEWITLHMDETPQVYLLTARILAESNAVDVPLMDGFFEEQLKPNRDADPHKYWEVVDRTTGEVVDPSGWTLDPGEDTVHVTAAVPMHEYTVSFLAYIIWDPVEMYNHLTNDWGDKQHEISKPSMATACARRTSWTAVPTTPHGACPEKPSATGSTSSPASCAKTSSSSPTCPTPPAKRR